MDSKNRKKKSSILYTVPTCIYNCGQVLDQTPAASFPGFTCKLVTYSTSPPMHFTFPHSKLEILEKKLDFMLDGPRRQQGILKPVEVSNTPKRIQSVVVYC